MLGVAQLIGMSGSRVKSPRLTSQFLTLEDFTTSWMVPSPLPPTLQRQFT